jgi:hypothetical protein
MITIVEIFPQAESHGSGTEFTVKVAGAAETCTVTRLSEPPGSVSVATAISARGQQVKVGPFNEAGEYSIAVADANSSDSAQVTIVARPVGLIDKFTNLPLPVPPVRLPSNPRLSRKPIRPGRGEK